MTRPAAFRLALAAGIVTLATVGLLGYRLIAGTRSASDGLPPAGAVVRALTHEDAQATAQAGSRLRLTDLDGRPQPLAQWQGKGLVINFWASWCAPCVEEMPVFSRLHERYVGQGVQFVGIGVDEADKLRSFVNARPVSYPVLVAGGETTALPGVNLRGLPYTLVLDRSGQVDSFRLGRLDEATLDPILRRLSAP